MYGQMHPYYCQITILLVVDLCSSLAYFMMTHPLPIASKLPIITLVAIDNNQQGSILYDLIVHTPLSRHDAYYLPPALLL